MTDLVVVEEVQILTQEVADEILLEEVEVIEILTAAEQGPPGRDGNAAGGALLAVNRLSEFDDETKKAAARSNLGLQVIDGGTFF